MALLCYALLLAAWILDLLTPQLFIAAILLNVPIALSSVALQSRLTTNLVVAAEIANVIAGYVNGVQAGRHWDGVALGDRALLAASFVLVGYMSVKTQEYAREAGLSAGRQRQFVLEKRLREAIGRVRATLNVELIQRAVARESLALVGASRADLIVREGSFGLPLVISYAEGAADVAVERHALDAELASLVERAAGRRDVLYLTRGDAVGRLTLEALDADAALAVAIAGHGSAESVLVETIRAGGAFAPDAPDAMRAFAEQAAMALDQARIFVELGDRNTEIARQKDELSERGDVIADIVYALAHDLRTPLSAAHVTMKQALDGAYGDLPEAYREILLTTLAANDDERRMVETLLLVARYESGEASTVRERIDCREIVARTVAELRPVAAVKGVELAAETSGGSVLVAGDPHEIRRAVVNLLANALDATPHGGRVVARTQQRGADAAIEVEDDGYGVADARRDGLFQRFGGTRPGGGTGLGLYIVRRIAEKHGGSVAYAPLEPRGSRFTMTLPRLRE